MSGDAKALAARAEARLARASFLGHVDTIKHRLSPATIVGNTIETARDRADSLAAGASDTIRARPVLSGAALGLAILLVLRRPLTRWLTPRAPAARLTHPNHQRAQGPEEGTTL